MSLLRAWVASANSADCRFPLNNLPYGVFSTAGKAARCGVAIGDQILDVAEAEQAGLINLGREKLLARPCWNDLMAAGAEVWADLRHQLTALLAENAPEHPALLTPMQQAQMHLPFRVAEFTDFYASRQHATNVGTMFRGAENALPPNWLHMPIGYNGRASTVVVSGTDISRPNGQTKAPESEMPVFGPCQRLDFELELGAVLGGATLLGQPVSTSEADALIFGFVLLNDWSARDIQAWEYQPLGPFQSKAFATSISPWIVTSAALAPFRRSALTREPALLPYLHESTPGLFDIDLEVSLAPAGKAATTITRTNATELYYTAAQQLVHHASSGCAMNVGDLLGSGTISGAEPTARGSLLELSRGGKAPLTLATGEARSFIEDGDTVTLSGSAKREGFRIGFGQCTGTILPALKFPE